MKPFAPSVFAYCLSGGFAMLLFETLALLNIVFAEKPTDREQCSFIAAAAVAALLTVSVAAAGRRLGRRPGGVAAAMAGTALGLFALLECACIYLTGRSFDYEFYLHCSADNIIRGLNGMELPVFLAGLGLVAGIAGLFLLCRRLPMLPGRTTVLLLFASALSVLAVDLPGKKLLRLHLKFSQAQADSSGIDPAELLSAGIKPTLIDRSTLEVSPGKNLVLIYLESVEDTYLDQARFPALVPVLTRILNGDDTLTFTQLRPARRATFTIGALYASLTGSILTLPHLVNPRPDQPEEYKGGNNGINPAVGNQLLSLPAILREANYHQVFLRSASFIFAGANVLLPELGYDELWAAGDQGAGPVIEEWGGMRDRELFARALNVFDRLANTGRPFNLTLLTVDSHQPDGLVDGHSRQYERPGHPRSQLLDAVHTVDAELGAFLDALKQHPAYEDTLVFVITDHPAMNSASTSEELRKNPDRKLIAFALNSDEIGRIDTPGKTFDLAPTLLDLLHVRHNYRFPLGESLLNSPDPRRLTADGEPGERLLTRYVQMKTDRILPETFEVAIRLSPYPHIRLGEIPLPFYTGEWGMQYYPTREEAFIFCIDATGKIVGCRRSVSAKSLGNCPAEHAHIIFCGAASPCLNHLGLAPGRGNEFHLIAARGEKRIHTAAAAPAMLKIEVDLNDL